MSRVRAPSAYTAIGTRPPAPGAAAAGRDPSDDKRQRRDRRQQLQAAVQALRRAAARRGLEAEFILDPDRDGVLITLLGVNGTRIQRQITVDEALRLARALSAGRQLLLDTTA